MFSGPARTGRLHVQFLIANSWSSSVRVVFSSRLCNCCIGVLCRYVVFKLLYPSLPYLVFRVIRICDDNNTMLYSGTRKQRFRAASCTCAGICGDCNVISALVRPTAPREAHKSAYNNIKYGSACIYKEFFGFVHHRMCATFGEPDPKMCRELCPDIAICPCALPRSESIAYTVCSLTPVVRVHTLRTLPLARTAVLDDAAGNTPPLHHYGPRSVEGSYWQHSLQDAMSSYCISMLWAFRCQAPECLHIVFVHVH